MKNPYLLLVPNHPLIVFLITCHQSPHPSCPVRSSKELIAVEPTVPTVPTAQPGSGTWKIMEFGPPWGIPKNKPQTWGWFMLGFATLIHMFLQMIIYTFFRHSSGCLEWLQ
jgi:hypothetical protein